MIYPEPALNVYRFLPEARKSLYETQRTADEHGFQWFLAQLVYTTAQDMNAPILSEAAIAELMSEILRTKLEPDQGTLAKILHGRTLRHINKARFLQHNAGRAKRVYNKARKFDGRLNEGVNARDTILAMGADDGLIGLSMASLSLLIRQLGFRRLVVLDLSTIKEMQCSGLLGHRPYKAPTPSQYRDAEKIFLTWADYLGVGADSLNLAIQMVYSANQ